MAAFRLASLMCGATFVANIERVGRKPSAFVGANIRGQLGFVDPIGAALVIDQAARSKFGDGDEASTLQIGGFRPPAADGRHIGVERQPWEIVAGQKTLGREVAIGGKIRSAGCRPPFEQGDLLVGLRLLSLCISALGGREAVHFRPAIRVLQLLPGAVIELPPAAEGFGELRGGSGRDGVGKTFGDPLPKVPPPA